ncbi:YncE family protein [Fundidesulfovibrio terrae]|uniref:YncE family protein n=1 Tax=Fundidesulfovibrio terrae TaxID=2922866 RepID=UPI001FAEE19F|nr:hypothetical protein [Fundidesulfovibrio terrae]
MLQPISTRFRNAALIVPAFVFCLALADQAYAQEVFRLEHTIPLPGVTGRIDHMALDGQGKLLFVAALGNNTVEVVDLTLDSRIHSIKELNDPQGVIFVDEFNKLFVANGGNGVCKVFEGGSWNLANTISFPSDADNIRYGPDERKVYAGHGDGALGIIDPNTPRWVGDIQLSGHPESFQLERNGPRIFVNVPTARQVEVVDRIQRKVIAKWGLGDVKDNFTMALDEAGHRLFVGCRNPAKVLIYDTVSGKVVGDIGIAGDVDDLFFDAETMGLYTSCGEGFLQAFAQKDSDHFFLVRNLATAKGARTSFFDSKRKRLFLAVPSHGSQQAEIRVYAVRPWFQKE